MKIKDKKKSFITDDSKKINPEGIFLQTFQNKKYLSDVKKKGYKKIISPKDLFKYWDLEKIKIIGITGTNGKTTTSNIVGNILKNLGKKVVVSGTEGIFLHSKKSTKKIVKRKNTTPDIFSTLINLKKAKDLGAEFFVMEVSSHGIFQKRIEGLEFCAKIFTNLSRDHLDFHKTFKNYCDVKSSFFSDSKSIKIINADDKNISYNPRKTFLYSLKNSQGTFFAKNFSFENGIKSCVFLKEKKKQEYFLNSKMMGKFNLYNILAAVLCVKKITDFSLSDILNSMENFAGVGGRMEKVYEEKNLEVFVDYAHTPDAIEKVLKSIKQKGKKIFAVVGAGGDREKEKRKIMGKNSCKNSDYVFFTSDNPRFEDPKKILKDLESGAKIFANYLVIEDRKKAIFSALKKAKKIAEKEKIIVAILGKGDENYIDILGEKKDYSDKKEVLDFFKNF